MTRSITLHSLAELDTIRELLEMSDESDGSAAAAGQCATIDRQPDVCAEPPDWSEAARDIVPGDSADRPCSEAGADAHRAYYIADLITRLDEASATLAVVARQDQQARLEALRDLDDYDAAEAAREQAEKARERAHAVRLEAEALVQGAFAEEARAAAARVLTMAAQAAEEAGRQAELRAQEMERLKAQLDLDRLLAERRRAEEAEEARAAAAERAGRLSGALARARAALDAGRIEEARAVLGPVCTENPDNAEVASLMDMIAHQEFTVKVVAAEEALWLARRQFRHRPFDAVTRLAALNVDGLPGELASHVFGEWARACARLCREQGIEEPLRYAPDPGRGAVLGRQNAAGPYTVVSALGMDSSWQPGSPVSERQVQRARPLR